MARIVYSGLVTEIKGSVGGTTFQSNRSGYIVRNKQYKGPVKSVGNVEAGRAFAIASRRWSLLSLAQRNAYKTMAATYDYTDLWGNTKTLTGFQWFMASTTNQFRVDGIGLPLAAAGSPVRVIPSVTWHATLTLWYFNILSWASTNADYVIVYATAPMRSITFLNKLSYRFLVLYPKTFGESYFLSAAYKSAFGFNISEVNSNVKGYINFLALFFKNGEAGHSSFLVHTFSFNV